MTLAMHKDEHSTLSASSHSSHSNTSEFTECLSAKLEASNQNFPQKHHHRIKLSKASVWFSALLLLAFSANTYFMLEVNRANGNLLATQELQRQSTALINNLRLESAQLTQFVRAYTLTGESRYLLYYYDIIAMRMGEKAVPKNFDPDVYWDNVVTGRVTHQPLSEEGGISVEMRMKVLGFTAQELTVFKKTLAAVAAMTKIEQIAFAATQGLYDPDKDDFVSDGKPHLDFAAQLVNSNEYNQKKADLATAIKTMTLVVDKRTETETASARTLLQQQIHKSLAMLVATFVLIVAAYELMRRFVLRPLNDLSTTAGQLAGGNYSSRTKVLNGVAELVTLGTTLNKMAKSIEDDIDNRRRTQGELEVARSLAEEATRAKSMFLANMSHEIRTPMNAIIGMAYLALKTSLTPRQRDYIGQVEHAARSLLSIINDILDFSKIEAGKLALDKINFRLEDAIGSSLSLLRHRALEKEIELLLDITDPLLLGDNGKLLGDPLRLGQVLTNLLSNAVKFTHNGYVMLSINTDARDDQGVTLRFTVHDTGIGMTPEQVTELFQEFSQADGSTTRKYGGTGLGLSISKKLIDLMGGEILVNSAPNVGSSFIFTTRFPVSNVFIHPVDLPDVETLRVLVIDNLLEARQVLVGLLTTLGVGSRLSQGIEDTDSAVSALAMICSANETEHPYDLVLMDWVMPGMDGNAFLSELRKVEAIPPRIVVTSAYDAEAIHNYTGKEEFLFLPKPVLPEALRDLFNNLTGHITSEGKSEIDPRIGNNQTGKFVVEERLDGMRVLLVEDNRANQQLATELMKIRGVKVDVANDGQDALNQLERVDSRYYHAVLMDLQMPVMDGYEATRHLRSCTKYNALPIVAMTAHAMAEERDHCRAIGMNEHISKPIEPDALYATLARFYNASSAIALAVKSKEANDAPKSIELLPCIAELDAAEGLRRSAGVIDIYRHVLDDFSIEFSYFDSELQMLLSTTQWKEAERRAHTLNGLSGTIGATQIQTLAATLELACAQQQREEAFAALILVQHQLPSLIAALRNYIAKTQPPADGSAQSMTITPAKNADNLVALRQFLVEGDNDAIDLWNTNKIIFSDGLSSRAVQRIDQAINNYQFDVALSLLQKLSTDEL